MKHWMTWVGSMVLAGTIGWYWPATPGRTDKADCDVRASLELPPVEPFFNEILYQWPSGNLLLCLPSGMAYDFAAVPPEVVQQLLEVEDKEVFFRRILLDAYVAELGEAVVSSIAEAVRDGRTADFSVPRSLILVAALVDTVKHSPLLLFRQSNTVHLYCLLLTTLVL